MNHDAGCYQNLTPGQIAVMHYNLRTRFARTLSAASYSYATTVNHIYDYTVSTSETFNYPRYMPGDIRVKAGTTLSVTCLLAMTHGAKIFVEKTGQLILDGGHITNMAGRAWEGIIVEGDPGLPQAGTNTVNPGASLYQGVVRVINGGTISNAINGISNHYNGAGCGQIICLGANFINNFRDVDFKGGGLNYSCVSYFTDCNFKTTGDLPEGLTPNARIYIRNSKGVSIRGCNFENNTGYTNPGDAIYSNNSIFKVDDWNGTKTQFSRYNYGIRINNSNPLAAPYITDAKFLEYKLSGIKSANTNNLILEYNEFVAPGFYTTGLYLSANKYYKISAGIVAFRSFDGAHEIFRNNFARNKIGINCLDNNNSVYNTNPANSITGLRMNCNIFNQYPNEYDIALTHTASLAAPTVNKKQGETSPLNAAAGNVVRNIYGATCGISNKWYVHSTSTLSIAHGANTNSTNAVTQPTPQPSCSSTQLNNVNTNIPLDYGADCPGNPLSAGGGTGTSISAKLENLNDYISSLASADPDQVDVVFERQAAVATKVNLFMSDTLQNRLDSVIALYENNQGGFSDAEVLAVFAYMANGDYTGAQDKIESLSSENAEWQELLTHLVALEQTDEGIYTLNSDSEEKEFFVTWTESEYKQGKHIAEALLLEACGIEYPEFHAFPEVDELEERKSDPSAIVNSIQKNLNDMIVAIFPNPANNTVNMKYYSPSGEPATLKILDILGREILIKTVTSSLNIHSIDTHNFSRGNLSCTGCGFR